VTGCVKIPDLILQGALNPTKVSQRLPLFDPEKFRVDRKTKKAHV
jgi:hypothetical protein